MNKKMDVIYFSGTGNTEMVVNHIIQILQDKNIEVCKKSASSPYEHKKGTELLLAFPINSQAVSPYIWRFMKNLPEGMGDQVHVVVTLNESAAILKPLNKLLKKKGYLPQSTVEISMPNNMLVGEDTTANRLKSAIKAAEQFAKELVENQTTWKEEKKGSAFVSFLSRKTVLPWITMRLVNKIETDESKCTKCGLCVKECPVHNIRMEDIPIHLNQCQFCMHCGAVCPNGAVRFKGKPDYHIRTAKECSKKELI